MQKHAKCSVVLQHPYSQTHKNDESIKNVEIEEMENENGDKTIKVKVKKEEENRSIYCKSCYCHAECLNTGWLRVPLQ